MNKILRSTQQCWRDTRKALLPFKWEQRYVAALHQRHYQKLRNHPGTHSLQQFDENRCIFIHVPKNGGISIANGLFGEKRMLGGHYSVEFYRMVFGADFDAYFKFAICRNPWDRLVSAYHYLKSGGLDFRDVEWATKHLSPYDTFEVFILNWLTPQNIHKGMHFTPQHEFICDGKGNIAVDYVGRFENMAQSFAEIAKEIGQHTKTLPHSNRSPRKNDYRPYYTNEMAARVADVYAQDIKTFGYEF
jgi:hypothetical protein